MRDGSLPDAILYGILGLASRFSHKEDVKAQGSRLIARAKAVLKSDIDRICLENVQACILVGNICGSEGDSDAESLFFGGF